MPCPNNCQTPERFVSVRIPTDLFVQLQVDAIKGRKGVKSIVKTESRENTAIIEARTNPNAYTTDQFFKYRTDFESADNCDIKDKGELTELTFHGPFAAFADQCTNCSTVYISAVGETFSENYILDSQDGHFRPI